MVLKIVREYAVGFDRGHWPVYPKRMLFLNKKIRDIGQGNKDESWITPPNMNLQ